MKYEILNNEQKQIIQFFSIRKFIKENFYWTGGTALAELYLNHRLSEDLDFFSNDLFSEEILLSEINQLKNKLPIKSIKYIENKNRQQFSIIFNTGKIIKLEFVYYPFDKIKDKKINDIWQIKVDGVKSIGENKVFALYETADPKHAYDLYWISKSNNLSLKKLFVGSVKKFGVEIDKIILLEKALEAIDKMNKIKPMIFPELQVSNQKLLDFYKTLKNS